MSAIIRFLGYHPLPERKTWDERLVRYRTTLGLSLKESASSAGDRRPYADQVRFSSL